MIEGAQMKNLLSHSLPDLMGDPLRRLRRGLGAPGLAALALALATGAFSAAVLGPLEEHNAALAAEAARGEAPARRAPGSRDASAKLAAFYRFFDTREEPTDWLAKLHAIAGAVGVEIRAAEYRLKDGGGRLDQYEITLPLTGNYSQLRAFLENALIEIPVASLDAVALRRERGDDARVQADVRLTLHLAKP
jgi:hypothetical protein